MNDLEFLKIKNYYHYGENSLDFWLQTINDHGSLIRAFSLADNHNAFTHYPLNDFNTENKSIQYYYHSHRENGEHGHIHVFVKEFPSTELTHYIAIGITNKGLPISLFTVNPITVDEPTIIPSKLILEISDKVITYNENDTCLAKWLISFLLFYKEKIEGLLNERQRSLNDFQESIETAEEILSAEAIDWENDLQQSEEKYLSEQSNHF